MFKQFKIAAIFGLFSTAAMAQVDMTEAQKRKALLPTIRTATDCFANRIRHNQAALAIARYGDIQQAIATSDAINACASYVQALAGAHEYYHGPGTGWAFVNGPYKDDLARAVSARIKPDIQRLIAQEEDARREHERQRLAQENAQRTEADRAASVERERQRLVGDVLTSYKECVIKGIAALVTLTSENADTIVSVSMTKCSGERDKVLSMLMALFGTTRGEAEASFSQVEATNKQKWVAETVTFRAGETLKNSSGAQDPQSQAAPLIQGNDGLRPASRQF